MTSLATRPIPPHNIALAAGAALIGGLVVTAVARRIGAAGIDGVTIRHVWLAIHLATVIPALPLGAYILLTRKGDRRHKILGRIWGMLMLTTALASFGVRTSGHLSWIHLLSLLVVVSVPRGVIAARRGEIAKHQRIMTMLFAGLIGAGLFVFLPARMLGGWLLG